MIGDFRLKFAYKLISVILVLCFLNLSISSVFADIPDKAEKKALAEPITLSIVALFALVGAVAGAQSYILSVLLTDKIFNVEELCAAIVLGAALGVSSLLFEAFAPALLIDAFGIAKIVDELTLHHLSEKIKDRIRSPLLKACSAFIEKIKDISDFDIAKFKESLSSFRSEMESPQGPISNEFKVLTENGTPLQVPLIITSVSLFTAPNIGNIVNVSGVALYDTDEPVGGGTVTITNTDGTSETITTNEQGEYHRNIRVPKSGEITVFVSDGNITGSASVFIRLARQSPTADAGGPYDSIVNQSVTLEGSGSDPDGRIVSYEWDFDGDGIFDWSSANSGEVSHTYIQSDTYYPVLRVTDDDELKATDVTVVSVSTPPITGLTIQSNPSGASIWIDGNDTRFDTPHTFTDLAPGNHFIQVRLTSYQAQSKSITLLAGGAKTEIFNLSPLPKNLVAQLTARKLNGELPLVQQGEEFILDASGSGGGTPPVTWSIIDSRGETISQTLDPQTVKFNLIGEHTITLSMTDYHGTSAGSSVKIIVYDPNKPPEVEKCGDSIDNDLDGRVDEGCGTIVVESPQAMGATAGQTQFVLNGHANELKIGETSLEAFGPSRCPVTIGPSATFDAEASGLAAELFDQASSATITFTSSQNRGDPGVERTNMFVNLKKTGQSGDTHFYSFDARGTAHNLRSDQGGPRGGTITVNPQIIKNGFTLNTLTDQANCSQGVYTDVSNVKVQLTIPSPGVTLTIQTKDKAGNLVDGDIYILPEDGQQTIYLGKQSYFNTFYTGESYIVSFGSLPGYETPDSQVVQFSSDFLVTGTYLRTRPRLRIETIDEDSNRVSVSIFIADTLSSDSGLVDVRVAPESSYEVTFGDLNNYLTPASQTIAMDTTGVTFRVTYITLRAKLLVKTSPVSGAIYLDDEQVGTGSFEGDAKVGSHRLSFGSVPGYSTPGEEVINTDVSGFEKTYVYTNTPPKTDLTATLEKPSSPVFSFSGEDVESPVSKLSYAHRLDPHDPGYSEFSAETSKSYSNLLSGTYVFYVKARDEGGLEDPTPASVEFTVSPPPAVTLSLPDTSITEAGFVSVPLDVDKADGILGLDIEINYNKNVVKAIAVDNAQLTNSFTLSSNIDTLTGRIRISLFGTTPLSGSGSLLEINFQGISQGTSQLEIANPSLNEGKIPSTSRNGSIKVDPPDNFEISGIVNYCITSQPIPNAALKLSGDSNQENFTDNSGSYKFSDIPSGSYTVTPTKIATVSDLSAIGSLDASFTVQHTVGLRQLNSCQQTAADVSGDGTISSLDAALIAQFSVGIIDVFPAEDFWKFDPHSEIYNPLNSNQTQQNYTGLLLGDVSGNWAAKLALIASKPAEHSSFSLSIENAGYLNGKLVVPLRLECKENEALSLGFSISYDPSLLKYESSRTTSLTRDFQIVQNDKPGLINIVVYGIGEIRKSGVVAEMIFIPNDPSKLNQIRMNISNASINEHRNINILNRNVEIFLPEKFSLFQNYPNPFNPSTTIHFNIPKNAGNVRVRLNIYNIMGQMISSLLDGEMSPGSYTVSWNGEDDVGREVSAGLYFYQLEAGAFTATKKMVFLK